MVDDVIVEADGEWHTSDDRYASDAWRKTHKPEPLPVSPTLHPKHPAPSNSAFGHIRDASNQEKSQRPGDVVVLDSEEEDEGEVKRELSPSRAEQILTSGLPGAQVIDLTVESDDESASNRSLGKRKAESDLASEDIWKKSRIGEPPNGTNTNMNDNVNISTSGVLVSGSNHGARRYAVNGASLPYRQPSHSTQFTPVTYGPTSYYTQSSRVGAPSPGSFGPQVSHRPGYYSQFGNIA
jgi:E3 SUMO-protein ligase PIAS1